jgi:hypothetical protein
MTRARSPKDDLWDTLAEHFGEPRTRTERSQFGKVIVELLEAGASPQETATACLYVLRTFDSPSVFAVIKWFTVAQRDQPKPSAQQAAIDRLRSV